MNFFRNILSVIFPLRPTEMLVQSASVESLLKLHTSVKAPTNALLPYHSSIVQACILEAKFHNNKHAQELLGQFLSEILKKSTIFEQKIVLIPVPLGKKRRRERGYNQIEEIARFAQKNSSRIELVANLLIRTRETTPQTSLGRAQRLENMREAFAIDPNFNAPLLPDPECTYILLDDVVTTGATMLAAHEALTKAGLPPEKILLVALAH